MGRGPSPEEELAKRQIEQLKSFFEPQLVTLGLGADQIRHQTLEELEESLERVNLAIANSTSFGVYRLTVTANSGVVISAAKTEAHVEMGILPILLERKMLILDCIKSLKGNKQIENILDLIESIREEPIRLKLRQELANLKSESERWRKQSEELENELLRNALPRQQEKREEEKLVIPRTSLKFKPAQNSTIEVLYSYAHQDEKLRDKLETQLSLLKQQGYITNWYDRMIGAGRDWENEISEHLNTADIILLLVSQYFLASDFCWSKEMKRAIERHDVGMTRVIPVILRHVNWQGAPIGKLQALPTDAKPVTGSSWHNQDEAFFNIAEGIRKVVEELRNRV